MRTRNQLVAMSVVVQVLMDSGAVTSKFELRRESVTALAGNVASQEGSLHQNNTNVGGEVLWTLAHLERAWARGLVSGDTDGDRCLLEVKVDGRPLAAQGEFLDAWGNPFLCASATSEGQEEVVVYAMRDGTRQRVSLETLRGEWTDEHSLGYVIASAGPDGRFGTKDDIRLGGLSPAD